MRFLALFTVTVAACGFPKLPDGPGSGTSDAPASGDSSGTVCAANTPLRCEGNVLVSCNSDGTAEVQQTCNLRCDASTLACENKVAPSNGYAPQLDAAATEPYISITANTSFVLTSDYNATTGTVKVGSQQVKATVVPGANGGPEVLVMSVGSFSIAAGVTLTIMSEYGSPRQVAIMSAGDVSIAGTVLRGASNWIPAGDPCIGAAANAAGADNDVPGGGGGAFGGPGAKGGAILLVTTQTNGGAATGNSTLVPLRSGCPGGGTAGLGAGGAGGGAIQITSGTRINVMGAVGAPGYSGSVNGGGGAGGGILLEAPAVTISGGVYANGGAGGCGSFSQTTTSDGSLSTMPALGGPCSNNQSGGNGGAGTTAPTDGQSLSNTAGTTQYAGGGGGAVGRIRINTLDMTVAGAGATSPPASLGIVAGR